MWVKLIKGRISEKVSKGLECGSEDEMSVMGLYKWLVSLEHGDALLQDRSWKV